ncbi:MULTISPECIES: COG3904 family protein [Ralstonia]|jgi:hypothetical protein|uniref:Periplasmic protein-like protein n=2 Tax=Ralstonia pickettii TaxID=329 RepID=C6BPL3_RALP1|nr:hypothetical protein [Ralstonia pickettii]ENZ78056.1 putative periplasmic protein [Ralstonia pickettii OR214]MCM3581857.1 hypothetical protein [Ralstonia pickettii]
MTKFVLAVVALCLAPVTQAGTLSVRVERPDWYKTLNQISAWNVVLSGEIDAGAPARVAQALKQVGNDGADVYLNSPGGNLLAGMQLGRVLRDAGVSTHVGNLVPDNENKFAGKAGAKPVPGGCYSACSLAFLGGVYRYVMNGSEYGVHRFSSTVGSTPNDLDTAQVISAAIGNYIKDMDVDPGLFSLMATQGAEGIRVLTKAELTRFNVANNGRKRPEWSIEAIEGGQYLRGVQDTAYGQGKVVFFCAEHRLLMQSFYQIGADKARSVAAGGWYHSLMLDDRTEPLPDPVRTKATGIEIATLFPLTSNQAMAVASSTRSIGHAMQLSREAPTYVGFQVDVPASATQKVGAFIRNCLRP